MYLLPLNCASAVSCTSSAGNSPARGDPFGSSARSSMAAFWNADQELLAVTKPSDLVPAATDSSTGQVSCHRNQDTARLSRPSFYVEPAGFYCIGHCVLALYAYARVVVLDTHQTELIC